jgi:RNAse (barnase) inhibitor barstar
MSALPEFQFLSPGEWGGSSDALVVRVPDGIGSRAELFEAYSELLGFPDYFGRNWDACDECLRDLSWISSTEVRIVHSDVPGLSSDDLTVYVEVLLDAVRHHARGRRLLLGVAFSEQSRSTLEPFISAVALEGAR